ncbi:unnamed protein product [Closterium sp. Naga37s-1]|nr:unnamed protein product [Closterium sp. Naga37s-1]
MKDFMAERCSLTKCHRLPLCDTLTPRITLEVSVRLLGGLMKLGYEMAHILGRESHMFREKQHNVVIKMDRLEQNGIHNYPIPSLFPSCTTCDLGGAIDYSEVFPADNVKQQNIAEILSSPRFCPTVVSSVEASMH